MRITETQLKGLILECINEVAGYKETMDAYNPKTIKGKANRLLHPNKTKKRDDLLKKGREISKSERSEATKIFCDRFPNASDPYNSPTDDDKKELQRHIKRSEKYKVDERLRRIINEAVTNEISQQAKAGGFVKANNELSRLRGMKNQGQHNFMKNGRLVDVDNEISRRERQMDTFGDGLAHDLSMEYSPNRENHKRALDSAKAKIEQIKQKIQAYKGNNANGELTYLQQALKDARTQYRTLATNKNGYGVYASGNDGYSIQTPMGHAYSNSRDSRAVYSDNNNPSNVNRIHKLKGITDAMMGYDDELNGRMSKDIDSIRRKQRNVQALRDYEDAYPSWEANNDRIQQAQRDYDNMSPLNPKKWFSKRPADGPQAPKRPEWEPNENGEFDGYFARHNPKDYDKDIESTLDRQKGYRDARKNYFG